MSFAAAGTLGRAVTEFLTLGYVATDDRSAGNGRRWNTIAADLVNKFNSIGRMDLQGKGFGV